MFKTYRIKQCFILIGVLTVSSLLVRQANVKEIESREFLDFFFRLSITTIACWLIHGYFLLHDLSLGGNLVKHFLSNVLAIIATMVLGYLFFKFLPITHLSEPPVSSSLISNYLINFTRAFFLSIICFAVFYSIHTNSALQSSKLENEILEQAHLRAQLISLQQQISPHFLFNSLSTLKTIARDQPTKNYVVQLASVYRYILNFNESYLTPLKDELAFIKSYLYIMNERFEEELMISINIPEDYLKFLIPPLSIQLLIENAIKHNLISPDQPLHITILTDDSPALIVTNNLQPKKVPEEGTGTGLKNIRERYKLLINRPVQIFNDGDYFSINLPLLKK